MAEPQYNLGLLGVHVIFLATFYGPFMRPWYQDFHPGFWYAIWQPMKGSDNA